VLTETAQAQQADATFLAYAPPPDSGTGALCLVDTGVNENPDTAQSLIASYAVDDGNPSDATVTNDVSPDGHGTTMAMIAAGAGKGILGVWPYLKIVSVRSTNVPSPGQQPQYGFWDYWEGMGQCLAVAGSDHIRAVDLALASPIPPTSDQAATFANAVGELESQNVAIVGAAGNNPGSAEEPAAEPNVFGVGADTAQAGTVSDTAAGSPCSFSASQGVVLYAPGCGLDAADPFGDGPECCYDGTSEASAFVSAVIVALMSYDPKLTYTKAEVLLTTTSNNGDLDVAAAFKADGLGQIVDAGGANTPQQTTTSTTTATTTATTTEPRPPTERSSVRIRSARWRRGSLTVVLSGMPSHTTVKVTLIYSRGRDRHVSSHRARLRIRTRRPRLIELELFAGGAPVSGEMTVRL
jgi:hypothetical protein